MRHRSESYYIKNRPSFHSQLETLAGVGMKKRTLGKRRMDSGPPTRGLEDLPKVGPRREGVVGRTIECRGTLSKGQKTTGTEGERTKCENKTTAYRTKHITSFKEL